MASDFSQQADKLGEAAASAIDTASEQARDKVRRAASAAQATARAAAESGQAAWDVAQKAGEQARNLASEAYARGERGARQFARQVEQRPFAALLIAVALGYAVAFLLHRRR